jgi:DNA-directed RNA polymerase specialized sigma24 family protein
VTAHTETDEEEAPPSSQTHGIPAIPSEIRAMPADELHAAWRAATLVALRATRSPQAAGEAVSDAFQVVCRTNAWDPARGAFLPYFLGVLKRMLLASHRGHKREGLAKQAYRREVLPASVSSHETDLLARAEEAAEPARTARRHALAARRLAELERRIAQHPLAPAVLRCKAEGLERRPADVAATLGVPVAQVYRAVEVLKYHLNRIRAEMPGEPDDPGGGEGAIASSEGEKHP